MVILKDKKGLTLVEVLISLLILGIIVFSFISLFGTGFVNIFSMGAKDRAMAQASDIMETLYKEQGNDGFENIGQIETIINENFSAIDFQKSISEKINYFEGTNDSDGTSGFLVTITISYTTTSGQGDVTLTSFFRGHN